MGQMVSVVAKSSNRPGVLRFEANRNLTGMGHEHYTSVLDAVGSKPAAVVSRLLLGSGKVDAVHVFGNVITVDLTRGFNGDGLADKVTTMYQYWTAGKEPPSFEDLVPDSGGDAQPAAAAAGGATGPEAEYLRLVPAVLVERSRAALAKWKATHG